MPAAIPTPTETVSPTPTASAPAMSGPMTGTISTIPAKIAISSQNGSPIAQKQIESTVATSVISSAWPRT